MILSGFRYVVSGKISADGVRLRRCRYVGGRNRGPRIGTVDAIFEDDRISDAKKFTYSHM